MIKDAAIIDADASGLDLSELDIKHKPPKDDDIHWLLWGVAPGSLITSREFDGATIGERVNEHS